MAWLRQRRHAHRQRLLLLAERMHTGWQASAAPCPHPVGGSSRGRSRSLLKLLGFVEGAHPFQSHIRHGVVGIHRIVLLLPPAAALLLLLLPLLLLTSLLRTPPAVPLPAAALAA